MVFTLQIWICLIKFFICGNINAYVSIATLQETLEGPRFDLYYGNNIHVKIVAHEAHDANGKSIHISMQMVLNENYTLYV